MIDWSGDGNPSIAHGPGAPYGGSLYSWVDYASDQGYSTLAIDRLGSGLSDRKLRIPNATERISTNIEYTDPDPLTVLGTPLQTETIHQLIVKAYAGSLPGAKGKVFNTIIYVGHSFGSFIGNYLNVQCKSWISLQVQLLGTSSNFCSRFS